jgi:hypothetical protein
VRVRKPNQDIGVDYIRITVYYSGSSPSASPSIVVYVSIIQPIFTVLVQFQPFDFSLNKPFF